LIVTELIFENVLAKLSPAEVVSLLSALVFQQKVDAPEPTLSKALQEVSGLVM